MKKELSKLTDVELREVWGHEAIDFTKWLAQKENLDLLGNEIGINIKLVQTEATVGKFNVDILAEEENTGKKIVIENQLEYTNHDHLGKIITYGAGYDSEIFIWIVKNSQEEHKNAIDWLNEHTDEKINFFLIKIELWQIDNSNPAVKFDILSSPNEWAKVIKTATSNQNLTETKLKQLKFWGEFKAYLQKNKSKLRIQKPSPQNWTLISIGNNVGAYIQLTLNSFNEEIRTELYIPNNKELYNFLLSQKSKIEKDLKYKLEWIESPNVKSTKIVTSIKGLIGKENEHENYFSILMESAEIFQKVFVKHISEFK